MEAVIKSQQLKIEAQRREIEALTAEKEKFEVLKTEHDKMLRFFRKVYHDLKTGQGLDFDAISIAIAEGDSDAAVNWLKAAGDLASPIHLRDAAANGDEAIVKLLLDHIDPNDVVDEYWYEDCPVPLSAAAKRGHEKIVAILLEAGADADKEYQREDTGAVFSCPLHLAAWEGHEKVVSVLLKGGADANKVLSKWTLDLFVLDEIYVNQSDHERKPEMGKPPVFAALARGHQNIVRILLGAGASPILARTTILHMATGSLALKPFIYEASERARAQMVKAIATRWCTEPERWHVFLLGAVRANRQAAGVQAGLMAPLPPGQRSALENIPTELQRRIWDFLVQPPPIKDIDLRDAAGRTALEIAKFYGHNNVLNVLRFGGAAERGGETLDVTFTRLPLGFWFSKHGSHWCVAGVGSTILESTDLRAGLRTEEEDIWPTAADEVEAIIAGGVEDGMTVLAVNGTRPALTEADIASGCADLGSLTAPVTITFGRLLADDDMRVADEGMATAGAQQCTSCGNNLPAGPRFCFGCGAPQ